MRENGQSLRGKVYETAPPGTPFFDRVAARRQGLKNARRDARGNIIYRKSEAQAFADLQRRAGESEDGGVYMSIAQMWKAWTWSNQRVNDFINKLMDEGVLVREPAPRHIKHTRFKMVLTGKTITLPTKRTPFRKAPTLAQPKNAVGKRALKKLGDRLDRALMTFTDGDDVGGLRMLEDLSADIEKMVKESA